MDDHLQCILESTPINNFIIEFIVLVNKSFYTFFYPLISRYFYRWFYQSFIAGVPGNIQFFFLFLKRNFCDFFSLFHFLFTFSYFFLTLHDPFFLAPPSITPKRKIIFSLHAFLVACTRLYNPLCLSVRRSVKLYFFLLL